MKETCWAIEPRDNSSWIGCPVRDKDGRQGKVIDDQNNFAHRYLDIRFDDGTLHTLKLNNTRKSDPDPLDIEFEYNPGKWAKIANDEQ